MVGTIGPLVQGSLPRIRSRLEVTALFGTAFLVGAALIFSLFFLFGATFQVHELPLNLKRSVAAAGLFSLALIDLWARNKGTYCPIGLSRQTPRGLRCRYSRRFFVSIWGFDTGLAITTFRVAAATWGAILLTVLGLTGWQTGVAYGLAFTIPVTILMWTHRSGRMTSADETGDAGLAELLNRSTVWQGNSAVLLVVGGLMLVFEALVSAS